MSGNFAIKGGRGEGVGSLMANAILNFHFEFLNTSLMHSIFLHYIEVDSSTSFFCKNFPPQISEVEQADFLVSHVMDKWASSTFFAWHHTNIVRLRPSSLKDQL